MKHAPLVFLAAFFALAASWFGFVLTPDEVKATAARLDQLRKMDLIGRAVAHAASEVQAIIKFAASAV